MKGLLQFLKNWTLPVSMLAGALMYFCVEAMELPADVHATTYGVITHWLQPMMLFMMLFLSFTKVDPHDMRPHRWQAWVLLCQMGLFVVFSLMAMACNGERTVEDHFGGYGTKLLLEGAMLCMLCPTATASSVITGKLGGSLSGVTTYLLVCNLSVALLAPALLTMVEPHEGLDFLTSFFMIMGKVFPLLICPLLTAWMVRLLLPRLHQWILGFTGLSFYIWAVSLAFAIMVSVKSLMETMASMWYMFGLAVVSLLCCVAQFLIGKSIGSHYDEGNSRVNRITAGQAFGQKNTVFIIWLGLVFLDPVTSVVGGFYSVWHNTVNSYQLYKARKKGALH